MLARGFFKRGLRLVALMLVVVLFAGQAEAGKWRGRCQSMNTGTDLGFVYGASRSDLDVACARVATRHIISEPQELPCAPADTFGGCEPAGEKPIDIQSCNMSGPPAGARKGNTLQLKEFESGRSCVVMPKTETASMSYCGVYSSKQGDKFGSQFCKYVSDESGCPWVHRQRLTVNETGDTKTYCWAVTNQADHQRDFTLWVK